MKKFISILIILILLIGSFAGCSPKYAESNEEYLQNIANKTFQADGGQLLTFYKDGAATYDYQNGVGEHHHYNYRVYVIDVTETEIHMEFETLMVETKNYHTEDYIDRGREALVYNRSNNIVKYHINTYNCVYRDEIDLEFTNLYGTPSTICAEENCEKYIAPSGNTRYCVDHAHACEDCSELINANEKYCVGCPRCDVCDKSIKPGFKYCSSCSSTNSSNKNKNKCIVCNGTGYVKYNYGDSDLQAYLDGYDHYTVGKCTSCNGSGRS